MELFDPEVQNVAEHFLRDEPFTLSTAWLHQSRVRELSLIIQQVAEDWLEENPYSELRRADG